LAHPPRSHCAPNRVECKSAFSLQKSAGDNDVHAPFADGRPTPTSDVTADARQRAQLVIVEPRTIQRAALILGFSGTKACHDGLQFGFDVRLVVAIEEMAEQSAMKIAGIEETVCPQRSTRERRCAI
jgi:hypothetical protein